MPEHDCLPPDVIGQRASSCTWPGCRACRATAARERAADVLRHVGLSEERYRPMGGYSTGMKQRVKLAQALVHDPRLVLLDEPTNGLDPAGRDDMLGLVRRIGTTSASRCWSPRTCSASSSGSATTSSCSTAAGCCGPRRPPTSPHATGSLLVEVTRPARRRPAAGQALVEAGRHGAARRRTLLEVELARRRRRYDLVRDVVVDLGRRPGPDAASGATASRTCSASRRCRQCPAGADVRRHDGRPRGRHPRPRLPPLRRAAARPRRTSPRSLFVSSLRNAFGLGRVGASPRCCRCCCSRS